MHGVRREASCSTWIRASVRLTANKRTASGTATMPASAIIRSSCSTSSVTWNDVCFLPATVRAAGGWGGVLKPVVEPYQGKVSRIYFRADAGFANPDVYEFLEAERIKYAIRLPANRILQERIGHLRPIGRPPNEVRRSHANFTCQAGSWTKSRRVVAKVESHPG